MAGLTNITILDGAGASKTVYVYDTASGGPYAPATVVTDGAGHVMPSGDAAGRKIYMGLADALDPTNDQVAIGAKASGGYTPYANVVAAGSNNATNAKNAAGTLGPVICSNFNTTTVRFVKFYNTAGAPDPSSDTPKLVIPIPKAADANNPSVVVFSGPPSGIDFPTGISFAIVGGEANNNNTAVTASDVTLSFSYK